MVFVFDWDGTLGGHESKLSENNKKVLKYLTGKGHICMVATGRGTNNLIEQLDGNEHLLSRYIVGGNGSLIYDTKKGKNIFFNAINDEAIKKSVDFLRVKSKNIAFIGTFGTKFFRTADGLPKKSLTQNGYRELKHVLTDQELQKMKGQICIVGINTLDQEHAWSSELKTIIDSVDGAKIVHPSRTWIQVTSESISKISAIRQVVKKLNLEGEKIIAFGDSDNDLEMIKGADIGVAMGDASESLKSIADIIIKPASENGIFEYIMKEY